MEVCASVWPREHQPCPVLLSCHLTSKQQCTFSFSSVCVKKTRHRLSLQVGCLHSGRQEPGERAVSTCFCKHMEKTASLYRQKSQSRKVDWINHQRLRHTKGPGWGWEAPTALHAPGAAEVSANSVRQKDSQEPTHRGSTEEPAIMEESRWCEKRFCTCKQS